MGEAGGSDTLEDFPDDFFFVFKVDVLASEELTRGLEVVFLGFLAKGEEGATMALASQPDPEHAPSTFFFFGALLRALSPSFVIDARDLTFDAALFAFAFGLAVTAAFLLEAFGLAADGGGNPAFPVT